MNGTNAPSYRFQTFLLDVAERQLFQSGKLVPLTPKAFDVLTYLVSHAGHLVLKGDLMLAVWPDSFVDEVNLPRTIHTLRRVLGEREGENKFIETIPTKGYRFVAPTTELLAGHTEDRIQSSKSTFRNSGQILGEFYAETDVALNGKVDLELTRQLRKLGKFVVARDHAQMCLDAFQANNDWLNAASAYREIGMCHRFEGNHVQSLLNFENGIEIIGENFAPEICGKLYTDMAGSFWHLCRPEQSVACLEKSVECFNGSDQIHSLMVAKNNLGISLILIGDWDKAEETLNSAVALAEETDPRKKTSILDSLAELRILKGECVEAEQMLLTAIAIAAAHNQEKEAAEATLNLARSLLAQGRMKESFHAANDALAVFQRIGASRWTQLANLIVAECYLDLGGLGECIKCLNCIEESDKLYDYFVLGELQRLRGLFSLKVADRGMALNHFFRCREIFENASDAYHIAFADYLIGMNLPVDQKEIAFEHLKSATAFFRKRDLMSKAVECANRIGELEDDTGNWCS